MLKKKFWFVLPVVLLLAAGCNSSRQVAENQSNSNPAVQSSSGNCKEGKFFAINNKSGEIKQLECVIPSGWMKLYSNGENLPNFIEKNNKQYYFWCEEYDTLTPDGLCGEFRVYDKSKQTSAVVDLYKISSVKKLGAYDNFELLGVSDNNEALMEQGAGDACWMRQRLYTYSFNSKALTLKASFNKECDDEQKTEEALKLIEKQNKEYEKLKLQLIDEFKSN